MHRDNDHEDFRKDTHDLGYRARIGHVGENAVNVEGQQGDQDVGDNALDDLRELMEDAPDDRTRQEFQKFINKVESM